MYTMASLGKKHNTIKQLVSNEVIFIHYVKSKKNNANHLTKSLPKVQIKLTSKEMGLKLIQWIELGKKLRLNSQISPQRFAENANKPSTFYFININPQCIIFLKLKPKTFKKHKIMSLFIKSNVKYAPNV